MELRDRIIEVSSDLFMSNGCKSVTMDEVAAANGISKRTLYEHFKDKTNLLEECLLMMEEKMKMLGEKAFSGSKSIIELVCLEHESQSDMMINMRIRFFEELKKYYPDLYDKMHKRFTDFHKVTTRKDSNHYPKLRDLLSCKSLKKAVVQRDYGYVLQRNIY